jgi:hypothetical protein
VLAIPFPATSEAFANRGLLLSVDILSDTPRHFERETGAPPLTQAGGSDLPRQRAKRSQIVDFFSRLIFCLTPRVILSGKPKRRR